MTRIFDALKKAEAAREAASPAGAPVSPLHASPSHAPARAPMPRPVVDGGPLPLLGSER
jgi:hypothetical protein